MASLRLTYGVEPDKTFELTADRSAIGRSVECEISLDVAAVSRRHAEIVREGANYVLNDLGSRNGTFLNGRQISAPTRLTPGDEIVICDQEFRFEAPEMSPPSSDLLGGRRPAVAASLVEVVDDSDDGAETSAGVMATIELGGAGLSTSVRPEAKLEALIEISKGLGRAISIDEVLPKLLDTLFKIFLQADRGFVVMQPEPDGPLVPVATKTRRDDMEQSARISRTIVQEAMNGKKAILSADAASDERFGMAESIAQFQIRSLMCVPLIDSEGGSMASSRSTRSTSEAGSPTTTWKCWRRSRVRRRPPSTTRGCTIRWSPSGRYNAI